MNSSLDPLVKDLSGTDLKYLSHWFSGDLLEYVKQKGLHPYECMDRFKKDFWWKIIERCACFSFVKRECITEKDYLHATDVWNVFKMNTMGDCHHIYLKTDLSLIADVFKKFIDTCLKYYGLHPCHYYSNLRLNLDSMLKTTEIELVPISDNYMHLFMEKRIIGCIYYIAKRFSGAKNSDMQSFSVMNQAHFLCMWMKIICMVGKWVNFYLKMDLNG